MTTPNYQSIRANLESHSLRLDELTLHHDPIYVQVIQAEVDQPLSPPQWEAFIAENAGLGDGAWEEWEVSPDREACCRFYGIGRKTGVEEFRRSAITGMALIRECQRLNANGEAPPGVVLDFDSQPLLRCWQRKTDHWDWLGIVLDTAFYCPTIRLGVHHGNWNDESEVVHDQIEEAYRLEWLLDYVVLTHDGTEIPQYPFMSTLHDDVLRSSAEAIRLWLGNDDIVRLDSHRKYPPVYLPSGN